MAAANQVKVSGSLYLPWIRVDSQSNSDSKFTAMIRVKAPPSIPSNNAFPIHLVVVLDVCGTTGQRATGGPRFDLLKMMEFIKGEFLGDDATQHQVDVATAAELVPIADWISSAQGKQDNHMRRGGTDVKPAMEHTLKALKSSANRVGFIILVSDGESKFDFRGFEKQLKRSPPVHAFGLGNNHDPKVLHHIAQKSRGTYSSVPIVDADADTANLNNSKVVMEAIALCLGGLKSVVASDTRVKISVPFRTGKDDTPIKDLKIVDIQSGGIDDSKETKGEISVGILYAGEVKDFIVSIQFRSTSTMNGRTRSCDLTAVVEYYKDMSSKQQKKAAKCDVQVPLVVTASDDWAAKQAYKALEKQAPNSRVLRQMILFDVVKELLSLLANKEEADTSTNNNVNVGNLQLRNEWDTLKIKGNLLTARENDLVDLQEIDEAMDAMATRLEEGSGLGCIYSWVSSYEMQRATTTGLPLPPPPPFLTPAMEEALRNLRAQAARTTQLDDDAKRQRAKKLLDDLDQLFQKRPSSSTADDNLKLLEQVYKKVKEASDGCPTPAATTLDQLEDEINSTIATKLFDHILYEHKCNENRPKSIFRNLRKLNKAAEEAIDYWRRVREKPLRAAAAAAASGPA